MIIFAGSWMQISGLGGGGREIHLKLIDLKRKMNKKKVRTYFFIVLCLEKKKLNGNN